MDAQYELSNAEAERQVLFRFMLVFFGIVPLGLVGTDLVVNLPHGRPLTFTPVAVVVLLAAELALALGLGY
jgi:hypothetical protein